MAKKQTKDKDVVVEDLLIASLTKDYGQGIIQDANFVSEDVKQIIPFSPALDVNLGGGVPEGTWLNFAAPPKYGKTISILHFCANAQQPENGDRDIYYLDVEYRLKEMNLVSIKHLRREKFYHIHSTEDKILSAQDFLTIAEKILKSKKRVVLIFDSIAALCHEKELAEGIGTSTRGGVPVLVGQFCRMMAGIVPVKKHIVISVQHVIANTSGYGAPTSVSGGNKITYQGDVILRGKKSEDWLSGTDLIGQKMHWICECNALGAIPYQTAVVYHRYGHGIDELAELIDLGKQFGLIEGTGWMILDFMQNHLDVLGESEWNDESKKKVKAQGMEQTVELLKNNPEYIKLLRKDLMEMIK